MPDIMRPITKTGYPDRSQKVIVPTDGLRLTDAVGYPIVTRAIMVGVAGTLTIKSVTGLITTFTVPAGRFACEAIEVESTGTTATNLVAMW